MKVSVFSEKKDYCKVIKLLSKDINSEIIVEHVNEEKLIRKVIAKKCDLVILDEREIGLTRNSFIEVIQDSQVKVILLLSKRENIKEYLNFNIIKYFTLPIDWEEMSKIIHSTYRDFIMIKGYENNHTNKFIIRKSSEVTLLEFDDILFFEKSEKSLLIHSKHEVHVVSREIEDLLLNLPSSFVVVHESYVVNFTNISKIIDIGNESYTILFEDYDVAALLSKNNLEGLISNKLRKHELDYIVEESNCGHKLLN